METGERAATLAALDYEIDMLDVGALLYRRVEGHLFTFIATSLSGLHSGRRRTCVVCSTCEKLLHEATTGPMSYVQQHLERP